VPIRAISFDFNGTLSDDEPILCSVYQELFRSRGRPLPSEAYYAELAGLSDEAIVTSWLGPGYDDVDGAVLERIARYRARAADGSTVSEPAREAVRFAAERVRVTVVSGAAQEEIEPVLEAAGLASLISVLVPADSIQNGKPHPEGYVRALELLGVRGDEAVAFEDTEAGVLAAKGAGMRCLAVAGTLAPSRLAAADAVVETVNVEAVRRALEW